MKEYIKRNNWNERNFKAINALIDKYGRQNPTYDVTHKPFAVFDWDNTSIIGDVEETLLAYMVIRLKFKMNPDELFEVISKDVDVDSFNYKYVNLDGKGIDFENLCLDIRDAYEKLYGTFEGLGGDLSFDIIKETNVYKEFTTKMLFRYDKASPIENSYCWMSYLLKNYRKDEIGSLCAEANEFFKQIPISRAYFESFDMESRVGRLKLYYDVGIRVIDEMVDLYHSLEKNGIDVYIVSASFVEIVREFATNISNSYGFDKEKVLGLRLKYDDEGKVLAEIDKNFPKTQNEGKVVAIEDFIRNDKVYGPIMVGGDSAGDRNMLCSYEETDLRLIIDRNSPKNIEDLKKRALDGEVGYYLQARDEKKGIFIRDERSKEERNNYVF